jgi:hypothetical protein
MGKRTSLLEQYTIFCLNRASDDDLYKIYYIKSQHLRNVWYRVIASAFGATSCSCEEQTKNPYQSCIHMKRLDKTLKSNPEHVQTLNHVPKFILDIL